MQPSGLRRTTLAYALLTLCSGGPQAAAGQVLTPSRETVRQEVAAGLSCPAGPRLPHIFQVGHRAVSFTEFTQAKRLVSSACILVDTRCRCEALRRAEAVSAAGVDMRAEQPGVAICTQSAVGTVVAGTDASKRLINFCRFQDGSMLSVDTLSEAAQDNDRTRPPSRPRSTP
jgi:hypothetical protein